MKPIRIMKMRKGAGGAPPLGTLYDEIMADAPWAYYQLGEAAAPTAYVDSSGNGRDLGNIVATVTAGGTGLVAPGTSTEFNGSSGYISCGNNEFGADAATAFDGDTDFTIVMVLRPTTLNDGVIFNVGNASVGGSQGIFVQILATGAVRLQYLVDGFGYKLVDSPAASLAVGVTSIVHLRREVGGLSTIWIDGVESTSGGSSLTGNIAMDATSSSGGSRIILGALNLAAPAAFYGGKAQHVAIFSTAISVVRIAAHVAASGL